MEFQYFEGISTGSPLSPYGFKKFSSFVLSSISLNNNLDLAAVLVSTRLTRTGYEWYIYPIETSCLDLFVREGREKHARARRKNNFRSFISLVEPTGMSQTLLKPEAYLSLLGKIKPKKQTVITKSSS